MEAAGGTGGLRTAGLFGPPGLAAGLLSASDPVVQLSGARGVVRTLRRPPPAPPPRCACRAGRSSAQYRL